MQMVIALNEQEQQILNVNPLHQVQRNDSAETNTRSSHCMTHSLQVKQDWDAVFMVCYWLFFLRKIVDNKTHSPSIAS